MTHLTESCSTGTGAAVVSEWTLSQAPPNISQTPFVLRDGTVMAESSVELVVAAAVGKIVTSDGVEFIPAGRKDMDVRMLGTGRPFTVAPLEQQVEGEERPVSLLEINEGPPHQSADNIDSTVRLGRK